MARTQHIFLGPLLLLCFKASTSLLLDDCPEASQSLCRQDSLRGHADLLDVQFSGVKVQCDQQLTKAQTSTAPVLSYSKAVAGTEYLFVMNDPDAPFPCSTTMDPDGSILHALLTMVPGKDGVLSVKTESVAYHGPSPPQSVHRYQMRLYALSQPLVQDLTSTPRRNFKVDQLASSLHLGSPVAVFEVKVAHEG